VTIAFGIRNVPRINAALKEAFRVCRTGGRFLCLEFSSVDVPGLDALYDLYSFNVIPTLGRMVTVRCSPWSRGAALLVGDAAHAIVPFFGQGMNAGFEDCTVLMEILDRDPDWSRAFAELSEMRKPDADAIAAAVASCPSVSGLSGGFAGEVATYLPGRRVTGVRTQADAVEVHVVARYGATLHEVESEIVTPSASRQSALET